MIQILSLCLRSLRSLSERSRDHDFTLGQALGTILVTLGWAAWQWWENGAELLLSLRVNNCICGDTGVGASGQWSHSASLQDTRQEIIIITAWDGTIQHRNIIVIIIQIGAVGENNILSETILIEAWHYGLDDQRTLSVLAITDLHK